MWRSVRKKEDKNTSVMVDSVSRYEHEAFRIAQQFIFNDFFRASQALRYHILVAGDVCVVCACHREIYKRIKKKRKNGMLLPNTRVCVCTTLTATKSSEAIEIHS